MVNEKPAEKKQNEEEAKHEEKLEVKEQQQEQPEEKKEEEEEKEEEKQQVVKQEERQQEKARDEVVVKQQEEQTKEISTVEEEHKKVEEERQEEKPQEEEAVQKQEEKEKKADEEPVAVEKNVVTEQKTEVKESVEEKQEEETTNRSRHNTNSEKDKPNSENASSRPSSERADSRPASERPRAELQAKLRTTSFGWRPTASNWTQGRGTEAKFASHKKARYQIKCSCFTTESGFHWRLLLSFVNRVDIGCIPAINWREGSSRWEGIYSRRWCSTTVLNHPIRRNHSSIMTSSLNALTYGRLTILIWVQIWLVQLLRFSFWLTTLLYSLVEQFVLAGFRVTEVDRVVDSKLATRFIRYYRRD